MSGRIWPHLIRPGGCHGTTSLSTTALLAWALTISAFAQNATPGRDDAAGGGPTRPPLFFSESWKALPTPVDDHGEWPAGQAGVANPNLQLSLHGPSGKDITLVAVRGRADVYPLNLWTGVTTSPVGATLRDKDNYVDLTDPLAKIRWVVRTSGFHQIRPLVRLADGTGWSATTRPVHPRTSTRPMSPCLTCAG
jgi:hypothetical protein